MSQLVPREEKLKTIGNYLLSDVFKRQIALALPRGMTPERMTRIALTEVRRTPKLAECSIQSLMGAVMQCAQLGLEPGPMGLAWIIPYGHEAQFQIGYKGILALVWRSAQISSVQAEVVYDCDEFSYSYGTPPQLHHIPAMSRADNAQPTHVYAVVGTKSGGWILRVMTTGDIEAHRERYSKDTRKDSAWMTAWDEMACKTVLKRVCKRAPVSAEAQRAILLDDQAELGIPQKLEIDVTPDTLAGSAGALSDSRPSEPPAGEAERDPETGQVIPDDVGREEQETMV